MALNMKHQRRPAVNITAGVTLHLMRCRSLPVCFCYKLNSWHYSPRCCVKRPQTVMSSRLHLYERPALLCSRRWMDGTLTPLSLSPLLLFLQRESVQRAGSVGGGRARRRHRDPDQRRGYARPLTFTHTHTHIHTHTHTPPTLTAPLCPAGEGLLRQQQPWRHLLLLLPPPSFFPFSAPRPPPSSLPPSELIEKKTGF